MGEESPVEQGEPPEPAPAPEPEEDKPVADPVSEAVNVSLEQLERWRADIVKEIKATQATDRETIEELKSQLGEVTDHIKDQKAAQKAREEAHEDDTTIVVPPQQIMQPQAAQDQPATGGDVQKPAPKRRLRWY